VKDEHARVEREIAEMPPEMAQVVHLHFGEGKGVDTIACMLAVPGYQVRRWLKRALARIRELIVRWG